MTYTYQKLSESGSFAHPEGGDVGRAETKAELRLVLEDWAYWHRRVGADERQAVLRVWIGVLHDVTDQYPDFDMVYGPRGGVVEVPL